jgi:tripartite-type tricarboxylate transporter receptor subunit TctC
MRDYREDDSVLSRREFTASSLAFLAGSSVARAQTGYADRQIRIVVGYAAGGGVDLVARMFGEPMKATLGQTVIVENRPGASAMIAANVVAKSPPDGLSLLMAASGEVAINQHLYKDKMTYDPLRELAPVALIGIVPCVVVVGANVPVRNAVELVATGSVTMSFSSLAAALALMQDGRIRAVAVTSRERMPQLPDVPTLAEAGPELKDYELLNWFGMFAPAGTPEPIVTKLNEIVNTGLRDKAIAEKLEVQGIVPRIMSAPQYRDFVVSEAAKFGKIVQQANIRIEN